jgi:phage baseplate assembly protein W
MSAPVRCLRFSHPDEPGMPGFRFLPNGALETLGHEATVRQALTMLLTTRPGERVMRPDYGCRLPELIFAVRDETTAGLAMHYVSSAIRRWEPRVEVIEVDATWDPERLDYRIRRSDSQHALSWELEVSTEF